MLHLLEALQRRLFGGRLHVWYHPSYRVVCPDVVNSTGLEPRRAELALWAMDALGHRRRLTLHRPEPAPWRDLCRVHTPEWLERITHPRELSHVYGLDDPNFPVDDTLTSARHAVQGTVEAVQHVLKHGGRALNLSGGFHHAAPDRGGGLCALNDLAIALSIARAGGFTGRVLIVDVDAHPPDGTAACFAGDPSVHIASLSCATWAALPGVDETVLPAGTGDEAYLAALDATLTRAPQAALALVLAGSDVLQGDTLGTFALTPAGLAERDRRILHHLGATPQVWLPAGGYRPDAWRPVARLILDLLGVKETLPPDLDPLAEHFRDVAHTLDPTWLADEPPLQDELDVMFGGRPAATRMLGFYTRPGVELALERYGLLEHIRRLGYARLHVTLDHNDIGDRFRLTGEADGQTWLLAESVLAIEPLHGRRWLMIHWLTLRHPRGRFNRDPLPGQDVPGLGLGREALELHARVAERLGLAGLLLRPAHAHVAWAARVRFRFLDPAVEATWLALVRDLGHLGAAKLSQAVAEGRVLRDGEPWRWTGEAMCWPPGPEVAAGLERFTLREA